MPLNTGSSSQVSRGGRGCGNSVSHSSSPCDIGSAVSSRCRAVVPVRGRPVTNTGRSIAHVGVRRVRGEPGLRQQPGDQAAPHEAALHVVALGGEPGLVLEVVEQDAQAFGVLVPAEVAHPRRPGRRLVQVVERADAVPDSGHQLWYSPQSMDRHCPVTALARSEARKMIACATSSRQRQPLEVGVRGDVVVDVLVRHAALGREPVEVGLLDVLVDPSRRHRVHADAARPELGRQRARHVQQSALGQLVAAELDGRVEQHRRVDHHDVALGLGERVGEQPRQPERGEHVRLVAGAQRVVVERRQRLHRRDRERVVEQHVRAAELLEGAVHDPLAGGGVGDVGGYDDRAPSSLLDRGGCLLEPLLGARDQHQVGALVCAHLAERPAEPGADAGEDDDLVLQQSRGLVGAHEIILRAIPTWRASMRAAYSSGVTCDSFQ